MVGKKGMPEFIRRVREEGYSVRELGPWQFRINDRLDIYPTTGSWCDNLLGKRGRTEENLLMFIDGFFNGWRTHRKGSGVEEEQK